MSADDAREQAGPVGEEQSRKGRWRVEGSSCFLRGVLGEGPAGVTWSRSLGGVEGMLEQRAPWEGVLGGAQGTRETSVAEPRGGGWGWGREAAGQPPGNFRFRLKGGGKPSSALGWE